MIYIEPKGSHNSDPFNKKTKIFLVIYRYDGDFEIHGAFSTKEKAVKFKERMEKEVYSRGWDIEELYLDINTSQY